MRIRFPSASLATLLLVACAPNATSLTPDHPASASAPIGRLAGPPPALRPGVAVTTEPPAADLVPSGHEHHMPAPSQDPPKPAETKEPTPTEPKRAEPAKKTEPKKTEPKKPEPKKPEPKKPEPKKPEPPAPDPHKGHDMSGHEHH